jgi:hypothetical protein
MVKFESKDLLLGWVCHRDRTYPIKPCMESAVYDYIDGSVLLNFSYSDFTLMLFYRCVLSLPPSVSRF